MRMRLISFLGTGIYQPAAYTLEQEQVETYYVAAALAKLLAADHLVILATEQAEQKHGPDLRAECQRLDLPPPELWRIPTGNTPEELWEQFERVSTALTQGDPTVVALDITHGFRSQPFFAAAVVSYLRAIEKLPAMLNVYYGEYQKLPAYSPIWELSTFLTLLDWTHALQLLLKTGAGGNAVARLTKNSGAQLRKSGVAVSLSSLANSLKEFSENIATVRCPQLITGGIADKGSARKVLRDIEKSQEEVEQHLKPLVPILAGLKTQLQMLHADSLFGPAGQAALAALAKLYLDYERYPEAAIVVREGWISRYAPDGLSDIALLAKGRRVATEEAWSAAESKTQRGNADALSQVRNDIQHGGFKTRPESATNLISRLGDLANQFAALPLPVAAAAALPVAAAAALPVNVPRTYFVSRHAGAAAWASAEMSADVVLINHLTEAEISQLNPGDQVLGTLPVNLIAAVNARGARYLHLVLELPPELRGQELTAETMRHYGARLEEYTARCIG